jgi:polyhydroxyalkanoate synthesis repressor PhaR
MAIASPKYLPILVRRYARNRLYDTVARRYLTVDDLRQWIKDGVSFQVQDSETGKDITRVLLA